MHFKPYAKPSLERPTEALLHCWVRHTTGNPKWPLERSFYWRLEKSLLFQPEPLEEAFTVILRGLDIDRDTVTEMTLTPVPVQLPKTITHTVLGTFEEREGNEPC